jgi:hypothetical protein
MFAKPCSVEKFGKWGREPCSASQKVPKNPRGLAMKEHPITETATEARQAVKVRPMKYVLGVGTIGAVVALFAVWLLLR